MKHSTLFLDVRTIIFKMLSSYICTRHKNNMYVKPHAMCTATTCGIYTLCSSLRNPGGVFWTQMSTSFHVFVIRRIHICFGVVATYRLRGILKSDFNSWIKFLLKYRGIHGRWTSILCTRKKGIKLKLNNDLRKFKWYIDAYFAGTCSRETCENTNSVKFRTGYVIKYTGCPINLFQ